MIWAQFIIDADSNKEFEMNSTDSKDDDNDSYTYYFRCTCGTDWYTQANDREYNDYDYARPIDGVGKCSRCHGDDGDGNINK